MSFSEYSNYDGLGLAELVKKKEIKARTRGLSAMPEEFRQILSKSDLRDLVEYLSSLK